MLRILAQKLIDKDNTSLADALFSGVRAQSLAEQLFDTVVVSV